MADTKKRLLVITDMFPCHKNPVSGVFVLHQVQALAQYYQVRVLATFFPSEPSVRISQTPDFQLTYVRYPQSRIIYPLTVLYYRKWVIPQLQKILDTWQPDLIHVHDCRHVPELICLREILAELTIPKFLTVHNIKTLPERAEHALLRYYYKKTIAQAYSIFSRVFFVNESLRQRMRDYIPFFESEMIGNAIVPITDIRDKFIDEIVSSIDKNMFNVLSVANLKASKGLDYLIRAVAKIHFRGNRISLKIIGDGEERTRLLDLALELGIERQVTLYPAQPNPVVRQIYSHFDLFALPSFSESFGIVYLEAMASCIPSIGVSGQGIDGVIEDGENGLLCQPRDLYSLIGKISWVMANPEAAKEMATKGQKLVQEKYMMDKLVRKLMGVYDKKR